MAYFFSPAQNAVSASKETLIESPQQHRDLQLLEEVLEKARKIRISQPDQQTAARKKEKRTERSVKQAEAVYKPVKKQSQRTSHSGAKHSHSSSSYRKTAQTRFVGTDNSEYCIECTCYVGHGGLVYMPPLKSCDIVEYSTLKAS